MHLDGVLERLDGAFESAVDVEAFLLWPGDALQAHLPADALVVGVGVLVGYVVAKVDDLVILGVVVRHAAEVLADVLPEERSEVSGSRDGRAY
jgi:hypothetical protein